MHLTIDTITIMIITVIINISIVKQKHTSLKIVLQN